jgi:hypothetical protein
MDRGGIIASFSQVVVVSLTPEANSKWMSTVLYLLEKLHSLPFDFQFACTWLVLLTFTNDKREPPSRFFSFILPRSSLASMKPTRSEETMASSLSEGKGGRRLLFLMVVGAAALYGATPASVLHARVQLR